MAIEFERGGKRWVLTAEHVENNADNRDADAEDMALAGAAALEKYSQLEDALLWLPTECRPNYWSTAITGHP